MYLTGFADEASQDIDEQIRALKSLGWKNIESRNVGKQNLTQISDAEFDAFCEKTQAAGIHVNCFGSAVANWAKKLSESPDSSYAELKRAIPRMHRLKTKMIRVMSFALDKPLPLSDEHARTEVVRRMKEMARMAEDGDVLLVHENCMNWAGQSYEHTLYLLDKVSSPNMKLVFDTGNPVFSKDVRGAEPYAHQDTLVFYEKVKEHVVYIHIKDAKMINGQTVYTYAGEGDGHVREILSDLYRRGYDGGISIEPHLAAVAHDASVQTEAQVRFDNFVEYGRRLEKMVREIGWRTIQ